MLCRRFLAGRPEECRHNHEQRCTEINEGLEVFLQDAFWQLQVVAQRWLRFRVGLRFGVGSKDVFGHGGYPLRVDSIFFLPSSTYPLPLIFGVMYVPSRRP